MYADRRVVAVIPAGRKRYLEVLIPYLLRKQGLIDEVQLWFNTVDDTDADYLYSIAGSYITVVPHPLDHPTGNGFGIFPFYKGAQDPNTVYIRMDDDIVWFEESGLQRFIRYRLDHPEFWLISANLINNAICSHIHQRFNLLPLSPTYGYACMDAIGWESGPQSEVTHNHFLDHYDPARYHFPVWVLHGYERFSINLISWLGEDMAAFNGVVALDEEHDMAVHKPIQLKRPCAIYGEFLASHYGFYTQRPYLDNTNILSRYKELSEDISNSGLDMLDLLAIDRLEDD